VNSPDPYLPDERLEAYLDNALPPEEAEAVAARITADPAWAEAADTARHLRRLLVTAPIRKAPQGFAEGVMARIGTRPDRAPVALRRRALTRWARFAAPLVLAVLVVVATRLPQTQRGPSPEEVAEARRQVEYTLALLSDIGAKAGEHTAEALAPFAALDTLNTTEP